MNVDDYVSVNRKVLKLVGLYPINFLRYILSTGCIIVIVIPQIILIYQDWRDLTVVLETSSVLFTILLAILKSMVWIFKRRSIEPFINYMLTDYWQIVSKSDASQDMQIYAKYAKQVTKGYLFLICNSLLFFFSLPMIDVLITVIKGTDDNSTRRFPFVALYPTECYHFPFYQIVYASQMIATVTCGIMILATDTLIATALFHTCGHFKMLKQDIKNLDTTIALINESKEDKDNLNMMMQKVHLQMTHIIRHHQITLWFCDNLEENFNPMLLLQMLASSLIICLVGLQVSTTLTEKSKLIKYSSYLAMALFQLLLFCFPGDMLIHQSTTIRNAVYCIQWYRIPIPIKTEVCMLILRSKRPCCITAGKFYIMHLENFTAILSTALSYFMMLRSFNADQS